MNAWPPPTVTNNPREIVQGEIRMDGATPYTVHGFSVTGGIAIKFDTDLIAPRYFGWDVEAISSDRLAHRPGVTL